MSTSSAAAAPPARSPARAPGAGGCACGERLTGVPVFAAGRHREDAPEYTERDLQDMADNFRRFRRLLHPPLVLGHEEEQPLARGIPGMAEEARNTGNPAAGWVERLYARGPLLYADFADVNPHVADAIRRGAYRFVSAEVYDRDDDSHGLPATGCVLRRVALLGGEIPQVKLLGPVPTPRTHGDGACACSLRRYSETRLPGGRWRVFFEVTPMDRAALLDQLRTLGWPDDAVKAIDEKFGDDAELAALVNSILAKEAGTHPDDQGGGGEAPAFAEWPEGMDREAVIAWLVEQGEPRETLDALSDDELLALYTRRREEAGGATDMSEPPPADALLEEEEEVPTTTTRAAPPPKQITRTVKFSEAERRRLLADVRREVRAVADRELAAMRQQARKFSEAHKKREAEERRREQEERRARVRAFCEAQVKEGKVSPAEMDESNPAVLSLPQRLMLCSAARVHKFSEGGKAVALSQLDIEMRAIEARVPRRYAEKVRDGGGGTASALDPEAKRRILAATPTGRAALARMQQNGQNRN